MGTAIARKLASSGAHVIIHYHSNQGSAKDLCDQILAAGGSAEILQFDVTDRTDVDSKIDQWFRENPDKSIDILVNNAGINHDGLFMWADKKDWDKVLSTSLDGFFYVTQKVISQMMRNKFGRVINMASVSGMIGNAGQVNYSAAKAGLIGATKALAKEVARMNITVNAVAPGFIDTEMIKDLDTKKFLPFIPVNRIGRPEEVAAAVAFLASEEASYITGEVINVNGGMYS